MQELAIADSLLLDGIEIPDNTASALAIAQGVNVYALWDTTDGSEVATFGNTGVNNDTLFAGAGEVTLDGAGLVFTEQAGDPGATANTIKAYSKDVTGTTEWFLQDSTGAVIQVTSGGAVNVGSATGTDNISWDINQDGSTGVDDDPFCIWTGGDGAAELLQTTLLQDSSADIMYLNTALAADAPGDSDRDTELVLGPSVGADATGSAINSRIVLRKHGTGRPVGEFLDAFVGYKSGNNAFQVHPEQTIGPNTATGVTVVVEGGQGVAGVGAAAGGVGGGAQFLGGFGGHGTATGAGGAGANTIISSGDSGDDNGAGSNGAGNLVLNTGLDSASGLGADIELGFQAANIFIGQGIASIAAFLDDNSATSFRLVQGASNYFLIDTLNAAEGVSINNTTTNGFTNILGTGALTVGGSVQLGTAATTSFFQAEDGAGAGVSAGDNGRLIYNDTAGAWQVSVQGGAYVDIATGAGASPGGADTNVQFNDGGSFGGNASFTYDSTNVTFANDIFADGGIERSGAGALTIGVTAAVTSIDIGVVGNLTTILGDFQVDGISTFVSGTTFNDNAVFEGNTTFGDAATDRVLFGATDAVGARIGTVASPNMHFTLEINHTIDVDQSTTNSTVGANLSLAAAIGADATGAGNVGGNGGVFTSAGGDGGAGNTADDPGFGGQNIMLSGGGGIGTATQVGGDAGDITIDSGVEGPTGGAGTGSGGAILVGETNAVSISIGRSALGTMTVDGTISMSVTDDTVDTFLIAQGAANYFAIDTSNGAELTTIGPTGDLTVSSGDVSFDMSGLFAVNMTATNTATITVSDNLVNTFLVQEAANAYIDISTLTGVEALSFGSAAIGPEYNFLGAGAVNIDGSIKLAEQGAAPSTGASEMAVYVLDDGGLPQLFARTESDGAIYQLTPPATGGAATSIENTYTAGEAIAAGAPIILVDDGGVPRLEEGDANVAARQRVFGIATAAIADTDPGDITTFGPVAVPDARWDAIPAVGDVGSPVYLSTTVGQLTLTAPGGAVAIVDMGTVVVGGAGNVTVHVNVKLPVKTI
jgi:hypothetical protein